MKVYSSLTLAFILRGTGASAVEPESEQVSSLRKAKILQNTESVGRPVKRTLDEDDEDFDADDDFFTYHPTMTSSPTWDFDDDFDDDFHDDDFDDDDADTNTFQSLAVDDDDDWDDDDDDDDFNFADDDNDAYYEDDYDYADDDNYWPTMSPTESFCPEPDTPATFSLNGHDYYLNDREVTWGEHQVCARQWGGKLSSIGSAQEQRVIEKKITAQVGDTHTRVYIGAQKVNDAWEWADGTAMTYVNWATDEPRVHKKKLRAEMDIGDNEEVGKWMAVKAGEWRMGIYKK